MARYQKQRIDYPMGSVSSGTMRPEDLIPTFTSELDYAARNYGDVKRKERQAHVKLAIAIDKRSEAEDYYESKDAEWDLDALFDALGEYAAPYFYFGSHPGDGADYGYWLSEGWDDDFVTDMSVLSETDWRNGMGQQPSIKVNDLAEVPKWYRGEVTVVNDHGNCTLYVKTSRTLREVWAVV
jgi:hypothetical protein